MAENDIIRKKPKGTKRTLLRLLTYAGKYRYACMAILALCFAGNLLSPLGPKYAGFAINEAAVVKGNVNFDRVLYDTGRMLFVYVLSSVLTISINILMTNVSRKIAVNLRQDVFDKLLRLPVSFFTPYIRKSLRSPSSPGFPRLTAR